MWGENDGERFLITSMASAYYNITWKSGHYFFFQIFDSTEKFVHSPKKNTRGLLLLYRPRTIVNRCAVKNSKRVYVDMEWYIELRQSWQMDGL